MWIKTNTIGNYEVNENGVVRNIETQHIIKPFKHKTGYMYVSLCEKGKQKNYRVHRLVAMAFLPNKDLKLQVNHIDMNKENNCVSNLEWCSASKNIKLSYLLTGRTMKDIHKEKARENVKRAWEKTSKPISLYKNDEKIETYKSISEASRTIGKSRKYITKRLGEEWRFD